MEWYEKVSQPFSGGGREFFDTGLKYLNKLIENIWITKIFESKIFVIHKVLPKFKNIWSHTVYTAWLQIFVLENFCNFRNYSHYENIIYKIFISIFQML